MRAPARPASERRASLRLPSIVCATAGSPSKRGGCGGSGRRYTTRPTICRIAFVQDRGCARRYNGVMSTDTIVLPPGGGRAYELGAMCGGFEASFAEWAGR